MLRPIVFDLDGVLANFQGGYRVLAETLGRPVPGPSPKWDDFSDDAVWKAIKQPDSRFWYNLAPLVSPKTLIEIAGLCYERPVYLATARPGAAAFADTREWATDNFLEHAQVVVTFRKAEFCNAVDAAFLLDDKAGNCVATAYMAPRTVPVVLDRPWNTFPHENIGSRVIRVPTVERFLEMVDAEAK